MYKCLVNGFIGNCNTLIIGQILKKKCKYHSALHFIHSSMFPSFQNLYECLVNGLRRGMQYNNDKNKYLKKKMLM